MVIVWWILLGSVAYGLVSLGLGIIVGKHLRDRGEE